MGASTERHIVVSSVLDGKKGLSGVTSIYPKYLSTRDQTDDLLVAEAVGGGKDDLRLNDRVEYMRTLPCLSDLINIAVSTLATFNLLASRGGKRTCLRRIVASPGLHTRICGKWAVPKRLPYARVR